jgi:hypothetical protein
MKGSIKKSTAYYIKTQYNNQERRIIPGFSSLEARILLIKYMKRHYRPLFLIQVVDTLGVLTCLLYDWLRIKKPLSTIVRELAFRIWEKLRKLKILCSTKQRKIEVNKPKRRLKFTTKNSNPLVKK